jgi:uncharacterized membrane protein
MTTTGTLVRLASLFLVASVLGWCVDTFLRSVRRRRVAPIRRIPFSPLYGIACLCLWATPTAIADASAAVQFLAFAAFICAFEYAAGALILRVRGARMWDYRDRYFDVHGHTDLFHFFLWGGLGVIAYRWALPALAPQLGLPPHLR